MRRAVAKYLVAERRTVLIAEPLSSPKPRKAPAKSKSKPKPKSAPSKGARSKS